MKGRAAAALWWIAIGLGLLLGGCCRPEPAVPIDSLAMATVTWFITTRGWKTRRGAADKQVAASVFKTARQRAGFVFVRARRLLQRNASWRTEPDQATLRARLSAEVDQVEAAIAPLLGTAQARGPLFGGTEQLPPERQHLDIGSLVTHVRAGDPPPITIAEALTTTAPERRHGLVLEHLDKRSERAIAIGWRAAAAEDDAWTETGTTSQLRADVLRGLVDRRLHAVELTEYRLSSGARDDRIGASAVKRTFLVRKWEGASLNARANSRFADDCSNRVIEPPSIPAAPFRSIIKDFDIQATPTPRRLSRAIGADPYTAPHNNMISIQVPWFANSATEELDWNIWPGTQVLPVRSHRVQVPDPDPSHPNTMIDVIEALPPEAQTWQFFRSGFGTSTSDDHPGYAWILGKDPGIDPATEIDKLFRPKTEWWLKPWLHADGAFCAVHLAALKFAGLRRSGTNDSFNAMAASTTLALDDTFGIRGYAPVPDHALKPGRTMWFENATAQLDELQIGDQVLVESLFPFLLASWWEYPTCLISNIDVDGQTGRLTMDGISVAGYVTAEQRLASYRKLVAKLAEDTLEQMRDVVHTTTSSDASWDPGRTFFAEEGWTADTNLLHRWSPYPHAWDPPGPWWIRIHLDNSLWRGSLLGDIDSIMLRLPKSVAWVSDGQVAVEMSGKIFRLPVQSGFERPPTPETFNTPHGAATDEIAADPHRCIFVPLYEPFGSFSDGSNSIGWWEFLKSASIRAELGSQLQPVHADGAWVTGLAGAPDAVRVIRPRAKKP